MTREELFNNLKGGARWDVGVSINRSNSLPLDAHSLFQTYEAAEAYASKDASKIAAVNTKLGINLLNNAYIGQILAVVEDKTVGEETVTTVGLYYIDAALKLQPVGKEVIADEKTIINDNGTIKLYGFEAAAAATYPRKKADGTLEWVTIQELVEGATENTITVGDGASIVNETTETGYKVSVNGYAAATAGQVPFKSATGFDWKDVYTKSEIDAKVSGVLSYKGVAAGAPTDNGANILVGDTTISASSSNVGHVYAYEGREYVSNGLIWEELGDSTDLSAYYTKTEADAAIDADVLVETNRATKAEEDLGKRITTLEGFDHSIYAVKTEVEASLKTLGEKDTELSGKISTLESTVGSATSGLIKDVADLKTLTGTHSTTLETLRTDVDAKVSKETYEAYISGKAMSDVELKEYADGKAAEVDGKVTTLSGKVTTAEGKITTLEGKVSALEGATSDLATIRSDISANKSAVASIKATLNGDGESTGLLGRVSSLETDNNATKGDVSVLKAQLAGIASDAKVSDLIAAVDGKADTNTLAINTLTNVTIKGINDTISGINGEIITIKEKDSAQDGRLSTLEDQIKGLSGAMHFRGVSTTDPTAEGGATVSGVTSFTSGDVVLYNKKEYVYDGSKWVELGDESSYALASNVYTKSEIDGFRTADVAEAKAYADALMSWTEME